MYLGSWRQKLSYVAIQLESPEGRGYMMKTEKELGRKGTRNFMLKNLRIKIRPSKG